MAGRGSYFAWGETKEKTSYVWENYKWCDNDGVVTKYLGAVKNSDGLYSLLPEDDAATVNWGSKWRTPTMDEFEELFDENKCELIWDETKKGLTIKSIKTGNSIYLPATGILEGSDLKANKSCYYWTSTLWEDLPGWAISIEFFKNKDDFHCWGENRIYGLPVRAVTEY